MRGGGEVHRVSGAISAGEPGGDAHLTVQFVGLPPESVKVTGGRAELAFSTAKDETVGMDFAVLPLGAVVRWELFFDDKPWPDSMVFGGPYGLAAPTLRLGIATDEARDVAYAASVPFIDAVRDKGLFVTRSRRQNAQAADRAHGAEGAAEMGRLMKEWGYATPGGGKP